jgi:tRNA G18 (ribose-2'-O)-methylase SpoU
MNKKEVYVLLDSVRSLYNVGSIFRTAEAAGVKKIFLSGISGVERIGDKIFLHPKLRKTALEGLSMDWEYVENPSVKIRELQKTGVQVVSLELTPESKAYNKVSYSFPVCLIVGHEREGVSNKMNELADEKVYIEMSGKGKSLNVSVAAAIELFYLRDQV